MDLKKSFKICKTSLFELYISWRVLKVANMFSSFLCQSMMSLLIFVVVEVLLDVGQLDKEKEEEEEEEARSSLPLIIFISVVDTFQPDNMDTLLPTGRK